MRESDHISRKDLSPFLIHWCRSKEQFYKIIQSTKIIPHASEFTFNNPVSCFTETPIDCLIDFENNSKHKTKFWKDWSPFGFLIEKIKFHQSYNGLPVIYSPGSDLEKLKKIGYDWRLVPLNTNFNEKNRVLPYEEQYSNYVWQREWRTQNEIDLSDNHIKIIVPNISELEEFKRVHIEKYHQSCDCTCNYEHTLIQGCDLLNEEKWTKINGTCPDKTKFPYVLIDLKLNES